MIKCFWNPKPHQNPPWFFSSSVYWLRMVPNLNLEDIGGSKIISMIKKRKNKRYENASSVIVHLLMKAFWQFIHKPTKKSNQCNHCDYSSPHAGKLRTHLKTYSGEKFSQMQPVYFEDTFEGAQWRKIKQVHQCMHLPMKALWRHILKDTLEKSQTNPTSLTLHPLRNTFWGDIWEHTAEKSRTNAISVTMHLLRQAIWGVIWRRTVEKNQTNSTIVTMHLLLKAHICKHIYQRKVKQMQPVYFCIFLCRQFEETYENATQKFDFKII